jgi:hypothetical protein
MSKAEGPFDESCSDQARSHSLKWREFQSHLGCALMPKLDAVHVNQGSIWASPPASDAVLTVGDDELNY